MTLALINIASVIAFFALTIWVLALNAHAPAPDSDEAYISDSHAE